MNLYAALAAAKTKTGGSKDGDWFLPDQQGTAFVKRVYEHNRGMKKTIWISYEIHESNAKVAGAVIQAPGTKVKTAYALHKSDWAIDGLKTDLVRMAGLDEKGMSPADVEEFFRMIFVEHALCGTAVNFSTSLKTETKDGVKMNKPMVMIYFSECVGDLNSESAINERKAKFLAEQAAQKAA